MKRWVRRCLCGAVCLAGGEAFSQTTLIWNSPGNSVNRTSNEQLMDDAFRFELGVFEGVFIPTQANITEWSIHWRRAGDRSKYDPSSKRFAGTHTAAANSEPFAKNKPAYIWGFKGDALAGEWILMRASSWLWPEVVPGPPPPPDFLFWQANDPLATAIIGTLDPDGSPFLMKSASVTNASPPSTSYLQWQTEHLAGEPLNGPGDDPDKDGVSNLLEFVFGTLPKTAGAPTLTPVSRVAGKLQIFIPRRSDHPALLTVEVSPDLVNWSSGPAHTDVVTDDVSGLLVRDLTPLDSAHPKRFMRLKAEPAAP